MFGGRAASPTSALRRNASTLVLVEHKDAAVNPSTLNAITAAQKLGGPVAALVAGAATDATNAVAAAVSKIPGVSRVLVAASPALAHALPEPLAPVIAAAATAHGFSHVVAAHSAFGKNTLPRAAALLDVSPVSDVVAVDKENEFVRPIYAGNALARVRSSDKVVLLTVRPTAFAPAPADGNTAAPTPEPLDTAAASSVPPAGTSSFVSEQVAKSDRPDLASAKIVVAGGRGLKSGDNFSLLYALADKLGGAVGASRAAVDAGFVPNDMQIGQTGKIIAPQLYIGAGISGAIQHLAGMKDSKVIVAINKDPEAPIFQVADYGLVADLFQAVPELTEKL
ncbi:electron transfer flavoprotein, alpha polypeptide [Zopfochytrium polystomum]|nr:electron transfer flavoprotein, alpha polypeptide [Zopfochytrium polystomum]